MNNIVDSAITKLQGFPGVDKFLYRCERMRLPADASDLVTVVDDYKEADSLSPAHDIESLGINRVLERFPDNTTVAMADALFDGLDVLGRDLLFCGWAAPHNDPSFFGEAFVSIVLSVGDSPYVLGTTEIVHESKKKEERESSRRVKTKSYRLDCGDVFVIDPMLMHWAFPSTPCDNSMLVILQYRVAFKTEQDKLNLIEKFPPAVGLWSDGFG